MTRDRVPGRPSRAKREAGRKNKAKASAKENAKPPSTSNTSPKTQKIRSLQKEKRAITWAHDKLKHDHEAALRREQRLRQRLEEKDGEIESQKEEMKRADAEARSTVHNLLRDAFERSTALRSQLVDAEREMRRALDGTLSAEERAATKGAELAHIRMQVQALRSRLKRYDTLKEKLRTGNSTEKTTIRARMKRGRGYKHEIRALARILIACGCKQGRVGEVVQKVAGTFGINLEQVLSRRTVGRIAMEGLVMARMQLGFELSKTQDITMSSDSTSRRKQNYQAHHVHMKVPVAHDADGNVIFSAVPMTRFFGVHSTTDHSTATSHATWMKVYEDIMATYNESPLALRTSKLDLRGICRRLRGMCGDHANNEKALSDDWRQTKYDLLLQELGEEKMKELEGQVSELEDIMQLWKKQKIADAGGIEKWNALSVAEKAARDLAMTTAMIQALGMQELASMDEGERNLLTVWVWTGCCMHKDQNSFKGGNTAMTPHWNALGAEPPIRLANKDTAKAVQKVLQPEKGDTPLTDEDAKMLESIARGGAKLTALAGAIFHNAIDKRGQADAHQLFLEHELGLERVKRFPQTNNTRFGSHGDAAVELLTHLDVYRRFMEVIRVRKINQTYTNIEKNVSDGLHDGPTLTELAVMAIYHLLITVPYMQFVRQDDAVALNGASLGPFHARVREHCELLIEQPELVLGFDLDDYALAALNGELPDSDGLALLDRVKSLNDAGSLPYLQEMFVKFVDGAMATWIRFSSEYAPGGIVDGLSDAMIERVWRPATNNVNEGALGSYVVWARNNQTGALHTHNGLAMCQRNGTDAFAARFFSAADYSFVIAAARRLDGEGLEKKRRQTQREYDARMLAEKEQVNAKKIAKAMAIRDRLDAVPLIKQVSDIYLPGMTRDRLEDQLEKLRRLWNPDKKKPKKIDIPCKSHIPRLPQKQAALETAFIAHLELLKEKMAAEVPQGLIVDSSDDETGSETLDVDHWDEEDAELDEVT
ncbi:hypothetical protein C8F01DRAFT_989706 [Mycena amicta]|nr:hypothetical protein C8F01DRAFT_989706 [Mycena amicta]